MKLLNDFLQIFFPSPIECMWDGIKSIEFSKNFNFTPWNNVISNNPSAYLGISFFLFFFLLLLEEGPCNIVRWRIFGARRRAKPAAYGRSIVPRVADRTTTWIGRPRGTNIVDAGRNPCPVVESSSEHLDFLSTVSSSTTSIATASGIHSSDTTSWGRISAKYSASYI